MQETMYNNAWAQAKQFRWRYIVFTMPPAPSNEPQGRKRLTDEQETAKLMRKKQRFWVPTQSRRTQVKMWWPSWTSLIQTIGNTKTPNMKLLAHVTFARSILEECLTPHLRTKYRVLQVVQQHLRPSQNLNPLMLRECKARLHVQTCLVGFPSVCYLNYVYSFSTLACQNGIPN